MIFESALAETFYSILLYLKNNFLDLFLKKIDSPFKSCKYFPWPINKQLKILLAPAYILRPPVVDTLWQVP